MLLHDLQNWSPFRIDALGIVTLLGADQVNRAVGSLVISPLTDYLPLLGAYVVAADDIAEAIPGFELYNVNDGIKATDIAPWFSRWLHLQDLGWNSSYLSFRHTQSRRPFLLSVLSPALGVVMLGGMLVLAVLMYDWWGVANVVAMVISVAVRALVVSERIIGLQSDWEAKSLEAWALEPVRGLIITPAGRATTFYAPRGFVTEVMLTEPRVVRPSFYAAVRMLGWIGFGCHVISLGMATLVSQLLTVFVLLASTLLTVYGVGADRTVVARCIKIDRFDERDQQKRRTVYHRLELEPSEEDSLVSWNLMPHRSNKDWWQRYEAEQGTDNRGKFDVWRRRIGVKCNLTAQP